MRTVVLVTLNLLMFLSLAFADAQLIDRIVAVVNNDVVTQSELDTLFRPVYAELKEEYKGQLLYEKLNEVRLKLLNQLIEDRLVFQEAKEQKIQANESEVNKQLEEFKSRFKNDMEMEVALRQEGVSLKVIRERLNRQSTIRILHDIEVRSKVVVSPLEIQKYYQDNPEKFIEKDQLKVRSITIKKSDEAKNTGMKDEAAWRLIQDLRTAILGGENFEELAKVHSQDIHAEKSGLGDWIQRGEMIPAIDETIFTLKEDEVSGVIETSMGYHIFRVEESKEGSTRNLEEMQDQIHAFLYHQKLEARFHKWVEGLKSKAYISVR